MGGKDCFRLHLPNFSNHLFNRGRRKGGAGRVARPLCHDHMGFARKSARLENLGPAIGKPSIAHDQHFALAKLARHGFHRIGAATGDQGCGGAVIDLFQQGRDVAHDTLKALRHMVQRAVSEHDREFLQSLRVNMGEWQCHSESPSFAQS